MRQPGILVLRSVSFLAIILQHVLGAAFAMPGNVADGLGVVTFMVCFSRFAVPAFVFCAGYVAVESLARAGVLGFWRKRVGTVLVPYFVWSLAYSLVNGAIAGTPARSYLQLFSDVMLSVVRGDASYHLWFMVLLVQLYLAFPLLIWLVRLPTPYASAVLVFSLAFHCWWLQAGIAATVTATSGTIWAPVLGLVDRLLPSWWAWAAFGAAAARFDVFRRGAARTWLACSLVGLIVIAVITVGGQLEALRQANGDYHRSIAFSALFALRGLPLCVITMLALIFVGMFRPPAPSGALARIDQISFVGYLVHPFLVSIAVELSVRHLAIQSRPLAFVVTGLVAFTLSLGASFLLASVKTPLAELAGAR